MALNESRCIRCVDGCKRVVKYGKTKSGNQRFICKACNKTWTADYLYNAYKPDTNENIIQLTKEGVGIRSTARILKISTTTLLKRIIAIAKQVQKPIISYGKEYEVDELCTYIRNKRNFSWIVLALEGNRKGLSVLLLANEIIKPLHFAPFLVKKIFSDRLMNYKYLIHKRLNRKTICFSKSLIILVLFGRFIFG